MNINKMNTGKPNIANSPNEMILGTELNIDRAIIGDPCPIPLFATKIVAGFPSPADDYIEGQLDLNQHLIKHPAATFFVRVSGDSMIRAGIHPGDILVVDRSLTPVDGKVVIAVVNSELTVKRLKIKQGKPTLVADNPKFPAIQITEDMGFEIWGVVLHVIHSV